jgi:hypothetical protein
VLLGIYALGAWFPILSFALAVFSELENNAPTAMQTTANKIANIGVILLPPFAFIFIRNHHSLG